MQMISYNDTSLRKENKYRLTAAVSTVAGRC